jgi:hypothetical protein
LKRSQASQEDIAGGRARTASRSKVSSARQITRSGRDGISHRDLEHRPPPDARRFVAPAHAHDRLHGSHLPYLGYLPHGDVMRIDRRKVGRNTNVWEGGIGTESCLVCESRGSVTSGPDVKLIRDGKGYDVEIE